MRMRQASELRSDLSTPRQGDWSERVLVPSRQFSRGSVPPFEQPSAGTVGKPHGGSDLPRMILFISNPSDPGTWRSHAGPHPTCALLISRGWGNCTAFEPACLSWLNFGLRTETMSRYHRILQARVEEPEVTDDGMFRVKVTVVAVQPSASASGTVAVGVGESHCQWSGC